MLAVYSSAWRGAQDALFGTVRAIGVLLSRRDEISGNPSTRDHHGKKGSRATIVSCWNGLSYPYMGPFTAPIARGWTVRAPRRHWHKFAV
jgi:hypothetical protein